MRKISGRIIKSVGGFYDVETAEGVFSSKARGVFRNKSISPFTGDYVEISLEENSEPVIERIFDRKNEIIRPPMANLDCALLVVSACEPSPNALIIDKLIAIFESKNIDTVLIFTKKDMQDCSELVSVYEKIGYPCFMVDNLTGEGTAEVRDFIKGRTSALIGNSGVGKSSFINCIFPELNKETNSISRKLGRGRHTTRDVEMYPFEGGYLADTPGFSTVDIERYGRIDKAEIRYSFREFSEFSDDCRFNNCMHLKEADCKVTEAVKNGLIASSRYDSYVRMYNEAVEASKKW